MAAVELGTTGDWTERRKDMGMIPRIVVGLVVLAAIALVYGSSRWQLATTSMRADLEAGRLAIETKTYIADELAGLPAPVQKYFRTVLQDGQPIILAVDLEHTGAFNMGETGDQWRPFTSTQRVIAQRPGFDWDAWIAMAPGVTVRVRDAYVAGEGILHASLFGLVPLVNMRDEEEMARGELMRFFAETAWYPTALLPSQGVEWEGIDDFSAKATLKDGEVVLTVVFHFDEQGLIESVRAEKRGRTVGREVIPTPWEGRCSNYKVRHGMLVPLEGEVAWILPEGPKTYWRGLITNINYEFAQ
jgi:hypothetical protein